MTTPAATSIAPSQQQQPQEMTTESTTAISATLFIIPYQRARETLSEYVNEGSNNINPLVAVVKLGDLEQVKGEGGHGVYNVLR